MISYNIIPQVICKMSNVRECSACSKCNVTMQTTAVISSNLTENVCLMLAIQILSDLFLKRQIVFLVNFEQVFHKSFLVENLCFTYLQQLFITHFYKSNSIGMQAPKIIRQFSCSINTQKTNLPQFFLQCWRL